MMRRQFIRHTRERGYALVGLLAGLTIVVVTMAAAVPVFKHELQREREEEMFFRGQQISMAIARYAQTRGRYPTKVEELAEKTEDPGGTIRFLRPSALCDPLVPCEAGKSNWRAVRPGDPVIGTFFRAYLAAQAQHPERRMPPPPQELAQLAQLMANLELPGGQNLEQEGPPDSEFAADLKNELGPIYGVVSKNNKSLIRNYLEIPTYNQALFFSGLVVNAAGLYNPLVFASLQQGPPKRIQDPRCPNGGMYFEQDGKGHCAGVVNKVP